MRKLVGDSRRSICKSRLRERPGSEVTERRSLGGFSP
jgi:hypothetical protein